MALTLTDLSRDPWLLPEVDALIGANMPAFMSWESPGNWRWHGMYDRYAEHQLCLVDGAGRLVAAANGLPVQWDGTPSCVLPGRKKGRGGGGGRGREGRAGPQG
ncbi:hypothetical protein ACFCX3_18330, partial [Streptomyces virginiae]